MQEPVVPRFELNSGNSIPAVGLGSVSFSSSREEVCAAVSHAITIGYRHVDTASAYGSEDGIGDALSKAFSSGLVTREEMFITTKLWCDDHDEENVMPAILKSLRCLQLDYVDLYLIHFPVKLKRGAKLPPKEEEILPVDIKSTWRAMEKCMEHGLTRAIGVSNFSAKKLMDLLTSAKIPPAVNQIEMHPVWQQDRLREFCDSVGIHVSAWSPLGAPGTDYGTKEVLCHPVVLNVAEKAMKSPAQVALRWGIQNGASVIPKSFNPVRLEENLRLFDWSLPREAMSELGCIRQRRTNVCAFFCKASGPYKTVEDLWDEPIEW